MCVRVRDRKRAMRSRRREIKDPYVLEFLALKDEYSETELEGALIESCNIPP